MYYYNNNLGLLLGREADAVRQITIFFYYMLQNYNIIK
jgi:hypothetical protein